MLGRQIAACDPAVCNPDIPVPDPGTMSKIVRRVKSQTQGTHENLMFYALEINPAVPQCLDGRVDRIAYSKVEYSLGVQYDKIVADGGYWEESYEWNYFSAVPHPFTATIYKRPGTNIIICNSFSAVVSKCRYVAGNWFIRRTDFQLNAVPWGETWACCDATPTIIYATESTQYLAQNSSGSSFGNGCTGLPPWVEFYYKPIASANKDGLVIQLKPAALASGYWTIDVGNGVIKLTPTTGTSYSFSGTLSSVASSISSAGGGVLFSASVPSGVLGGVALVDDLKPFRVSDVGTASCSVGVPIILAGEKVPPSNISSSHFFRLFDSGGGCAGRLQVPYSEAVDQGEPDTHEAYEAWLKRPRYPKKDQDISIGVVFGPRMFTTEWLYGQLCIFGSGCTVTDILQYWNESPGNVTFNWSQPTESGLTKTVITKTLTCSECGDPPGGGPGSGGCPGSTVRAIYGCDYPLPTGFGLCSGGQVVWKGWSVGEQVTSVDVDVLESSEVFSGEWSLQ